MIEFDSISDRLYRVIRQAGKDTGKQVRLDIVGASIELDRGVLERMTAAFEHLLRNCVAHGIESAPDRHAAGKETAGLITIQVRQEGNDVAIEFKDDGAGLNVAKILEKAEQKGLISKTTVLSEQEIFNLIYNSGFSTANEVSAVAGRGVGMDVVKSEVQALGGRIETNSSSGKGSSFKLVLPLTTAVTQVVMVRAGHITFGIPANLLEIIRRATPQEIEQAYAERHINFQTERVPFHWIGALLQASASSVEPIGRSTPIAIIRSASQRVAVHIDEVLGNQEVVVKNLGPQLSRLPGLAGMSLLPSGAVVLIYNPVALHTVYNDRAAAFIEQVKQSKLHAQLSTEAQTALIMVVDDSVTVRRVTQRLLQREGYRVVLANDGLMALEKLAEGEELPSVILSDIEMPRMDGYDLARNIRADERLKALPIVMITSRMAEKHREHAMSLGVDHYLGKPYGEEELLEIIRSYTHTETV
jgi:chemosensory pili system protein ChpA (sensor histidine kinase/response regulator)